MRANPLLLSSKTPPPAGGGLTYVLKTPTNTGNKTEGSHTEAYNCGTVTAGNELLVIICTTKGNTAATTIFSLPVKASGTATIGTAVHLGTATTSGTYRAVTSMYRIPITGSGTLTLTFDDAVATHGFGTAVLEFNGQHATPVAGFIADGNMSIDGAETLTLAATPAAGDYTVAAIDLDTDGGAGTRAVDVGAGFTEIVNHGSTSDYLMMQVQVRTGSTSTNVPWVDVKPVGAPVVFTAAGAAVIVKAA